MSATNAGELKLHDKTLKFGKGEISIDTNGPPTVKMTLSPDFGQVQCSMSGSTKDPDRFAFGGNIKLTFLQKSVSGNVDFKHSPNDTTLTINIADNSDLTNWIFGGGDLRFLLLDHLKLEGVDFSGCNLSGVSFTGSDCYRSKFNGSILTGANFQGVRLPNAVFCGATMTGADFRKADLRQANLEKTKVDAETKFNGADLTGVKNLGSVSGLDKVKDGADTISKALKPPGGGGGSGGSKPPDPPKPKKPPRP